MCNRLSADEADRCQNSRPLRGLKWLHYNCLHAQHDVGGPGTLQSWRGQRDGGNRLRGGKNLGGGQYHAELLLAHQKGSPLHRLQQQPWARHMHVERTRNQAIICGRKWQGPTWREHAEPFGGSPGWHSGPSARGPRGAGRGAPTVHWGSTPGHQWGGHKVNGSHTTGACWAPQAVHWDRFFHRTSLLNRGPMWMPLRPPAFQNQPGFGMEVLNCLQELKIRPIWTTLSCLKWAAGDELAALSTLFNSSSTYVHLFWVF